MALRLICEGPRDSAPTCFPLDQPMAITVQGDCTRVALPAVSTGHYEIIIGSLARAGERFDLQISCTDRSGRPTARALPIVCPVLHNNDLLEAQHVRRAFSSGHEKSEFTFNSCQHHVVLEERPLVARAEKPSQNEFWLHVTSGPPQDPRHSARLRVRELCRGGGLRVVLDRQVAATPRYMAWAAEMLQTAEQYRVHLQQRIGFFQDIDGDGVLTVVLTPWLDRLQGGKTSVLGLVRRQDFTNDYCPPLSNQSDVVFLNTRLLSDLRWPTILAHEMMHAVCFSLRAPSVAPADKRLSASGNRWPRPRYPAESDWLNEGLAYVEEVRMSGGWQNVNHRLQAFLNETADSPLTIHDLQQAGRWRDDGCRGAAFLFADWLQCRFGPGIVPKLVTQPARGRANVELATGETFATLFRGWSIDVCGLATCSSKTNPRTGSTGGRQPTESGCSPFSAQVTHRADTTKLVQELQEGTTLSRTLAGSGLMCVKIRATAAPAGTQLQFDCPKSACLQITVIRRN